MSAPRDVSSDAFRHFSRLALSLAHTHRHYASCLKGKQGKTGCRFAMGAVHFTQDFGRPPRETNSILELVHGVHLQSEAGNYPGDIEFRCPSCYCGRVRLAEQHHAATTNDDGEANGEAAAQKMDVDEPEKTVGGGGRAMDVDEAAADATTTTSSSATSTPPAVATATSVKAGATGAPSAEDQDAARQQEDLRRNVFFYAQDPQPRQSAIGPDTRPLVLQLHRPRLPSQQASDALSGFLREGIANKEPIALKGAAARSKAAELLADGELLSGLLRKEGFEALKERLWPLRGYVAGGGSYDADDANERNLDRDAEVLCLVASAPELECANSLIATGNDVVAGVTAANAVSNPLGVGEGSAAAEAYASEYVSKKRFRA